MCSAEDIVRFPLHLVSVVLIYLLLFRKTEPFLLFIARELILATVAETVFFAKR